MIVTPANCDTPQRGRGHSLLGVAIILLLAWACGPRVTRRAVNLRTVGGALLILLVFAWLVLKTPLNVGFRFANAVVERLLGFAHAGASFVFGSLVTNASSFGYIFAFQVLPTIIFFSALMSILYHFRILPWVVSSIGRGLTRTLRVSGAEALATAADIFRGTGGVAIGGTPLRCSDDALRDQRVYGCRLRYDCGWRVGCLHFDVVELGSEHRCAPDRGERDGRTGVVGDRQVDVP